MLPALEKSGDEWTWEFVHLTRNHWFEASAVTWAPLMFICLGRCVVQWVFVSHLLLKDPTWNAQKSLLRQKIDPCWISCILVNLLHRLKSLWLDLPSARDLQFKLCIFPWVGGTLTLEFHASVSVLAVCLGTNYWNILCFSDLIYRMMERKPTSPLQNCGEDN